MSDPTNPGEDFRGTRESKRQQETVMLGADALSSLVDQAKAEPAAVEPAAEPSSDVGAGGSKRLVLIAAGVVVLIALVVLVVVLVS